MNTCITCGATIPKGAMYCPADRPIGIPERKNT